MISRLPRDKAKPTAVPTNGAEHGVASKVATKPPAKCDGTDDTIPLRASAFVSPGGSEISNKPRRLAAKSAITAAITARKTGC